MTDHVFNLEKDLGPSEVHRLVVGKTTPAEIISIRYNDKTGVANVTTRALPAFGTLDPESDESKLVNSIVENEQTILNVLERDRQQLDAREANILSRENALDQRDANLITEELKQENQQKEIDRLMAELRKGEKTKFIGKLKSIFHRIN